MMHGIHIDSLKFFLIDINECLLKTHNCTHDCHNTVGSYLCGCKPGCKLTDDNISCEGYIIFCLI